VSYVKCSLGLGRAPVYGVALKSNGRRPVTDGVSLYCADVRHICIIKRCSRRRRLLSAVDWWVTQVLLDQARTWLQDGCLATRRPVYRPPVAGSGYCSSCSAPECVTHQSRDSHVSRQSCFTRTFCSMFLRRYVIYLVMFWKKVLEPKQVSCTGRVASIPIPGGRSLRPVKNREGVLIRLYIKIFPLFLLGKLHP